MPGNEVRALVLRDELQQHWQTKDVFALVQQLNGDVARSVKGRETRRFELGGRAYYRKLHTGVGWGEIFKNLIRGRLPVIGARNEWLALNRLMEIGVPSLVPVAWGEKYFNPAHRLSFIVTRELADTVELDAYLASSKSNPPGFLQKLQLLEEIARIARLLHSHGINHRDLYLCHFMLDNQCIADWREGNLPPRLHLVDLHRAQLRKYVPVHWQVKDIASIYFSAKDFDLTSRDLLRFARIYFAMPLADVLNKHKKLLGKIQRRADSLYQREQRLKARGLRP